MHFIDTNIFIRYLTKDDPDKAQACFELLKQAETNQITLTTTEAVITEVVYVLSSKKTYNLARDEIRVRLYPLLSVQRLQLPQRITFLRALDLYTLHQIDLGAVPAPSPSYIKFKLVHKLVKVQAFDISKR